MHFNVCCMYVSVCTDNYVFLEYFFKSVLYFILTGTRSWKGHSKSSLFPQKSNGPGIFLQITHPLSNLSPGGGSVFIVKLFFLNLRFFFPLPLKGFVPAMNALAWYYEQYEKNYQQAVLLWEQADELQNPDAPLNLGVMYANGLYPGKAADQVSTNQSGAIQKHFFCFVYYNMYTIFILAVYGLQVLSKGCTERKHQGSNYTCWHVDRWHFWLRS